MTASVSPNRPLTVLLSALAVASAAGCAAGQNDATSHEHSTPYVANVDAAGGLAIRDVVVTIDATKPNAGFLSLVIVNNGSQPDALTGAQVEDGTVTPTEASAIPAVAPSHTLTFIDPQTTQVSSVSGQVAGGLAVTNLSKPLVDGTSVTVTLEFSTAGQVTVRAPVVSAPGS